MKIIDVHHKTYRQIAFEMHTEESDFYCPKCGGKVHRDLYRPSARKIPLFCHPCEYIFEIEMHDYTEYKFIERPSEEEELALIEEFEERKNHRGVENAMTAMEIKHGLKMIRIFRRLGLDTNKK